MGISRNAVFIGTGLALVLAFILRWLIHAFVVFPYVVQQDDMAPALPADETVYILQQFNPAELQRGDVILLEHPFHPDMFMLRRVIALPGEQIQMHDRQVYIDNQPLYSVWEQTIQSEIEYTGSPINLGSVRRDSTAALIVPAGSVYVLADRRDRTTDSRQMGPISFKHIRGVVWREVEN
ncbi:MAG: signal peptidase I [Leptospiraceae bacterium]|nr:signal peptidase I [Leptospiraceae bacterium]MCB1314438.1 signal peptidase I [Leptospiraceae bacterium]